MSNLPEGFLAKLKKDTEASITHQAYKSSKVTVKQMSLRQQKDIIATAIDGIQGAVGFAKAINDVILENSDKSDLLVVDKVPILLKLRKLSLGNDIVVEEEILDIDRFIKNIETVEPAFKKSETIKRDSISIGLKIPSLKEENAILAKCLTEVEKKENKKTSEAFGVIYLYELMKYIKTIKIGEDEVDFSTLKVAERVQIIENLPLSIYKQLSKFFQNITKYDTDLLTVDDKTITIDPTFFDTST